MLKLYLWIRNMLEGEEGQDLVEYALIIALISIVLVGALSLLATDIQTVFTEIGKKLPPATL